MTTMVMAYLFVVFEKMQDIYILGVQDQLKNEIDTQDHVITFL